MNIECPTTPSEIAGLSARKAEVQSLLEGVRNSFILSRPFYAHLGFALKLKVVADDRVQTAATDGETIFFSVFFWEQLQPEERAFVFAHELLHCALGHFYRRALRDPEMWNIAADQEVNQRLVDEGFAMPTGGILENKLKGMSAEEAYDRLKSDDRLRRKLAIGAPEGRMILRGLVDPDFVLNSNASISDHAIRVAQARRAAKMHGSQKHGKSKSLADLDKKAKKDVLPWRMVLASFFDAAVNSNYSWARQARRHVGRGVYLPSRHKGAYELTLAVDVSGSTLPDIPQFMTELRQLLKAAPCSKLTVLTFDHKVQIVQSVDSLDEIEPFSRRLVGGGGTNITPVFEWLAASREIHSNLIVLTDGYFAKPKREAPVGQLLYVLTKDGRQQEFMENAIHLSA